MGRLMVREKWKSASKTYINCDICGKKILFTRRNRQRCSNTGKGKKNTACQKEAMRRLSRGEVKTARRKIKTRPSRGKSKKHECLKCGGLFKPVGEYNRICEKCTIENERYREVATSYNIAVKDMGYTEGYNDY